jgi:flagellin
MRINHNIPAMITQGALCLLNREMTKSLEKLSTGLRINRASDDAACLGISENLRTQVIGTAQAIRNAQDGIAAITIAEGSANEISSILQRMRELAVQSANDTLTSLERSYTNLEFGALIEEIDRIANVTNYNKQKLISDTSNRFGNYLTGSILWIDANSSVGIDSITIFISTLTSAILSINDNDIDTQQDAVSSISALDIAIDSVNRMRADLGAYINRLDHTINNLTISNTNQQAAESLVRDVDFAKEVSYFTKLQILTESATAMLAQANLVPELILDLLNF